MPRNSFDININLRGFNKAQSTVNKTKDGMDRLRTSTSGLRRSIGALRNNLLLISFTFGALIKLSEKLVDAYRKQINEERKLEAGLKNIAGTSSKTATSLKNLAAQLQQTTTFGDETTISGMALLTTFQLSEATIRELTPRMLDMAAAMGGDVSSAALQLGKAFTGQVSALSRSGVVIDQVGLAIARTEGPAAEAAFLFEQLDNNFKGFAAAVRNSPIGELDALKNELGDINEELGKASVPIQLYWQKTKLHLAKAIGFWGFFLDELNLATDDAATIISRLSQVFDIATKKYNEAFNSAAGAVDESGEALVNWDKKLKLNLITLQHNASAMSALAELYSGHEKSMVPFLSLKEQEIKIGAELKILMDAKANGMVKELEVGKEAEALQIAKQEGLMSEIEWTMKHNELLVKQMKLEAQRQQQQKQVIAETLSMLTQVTSAWKSNMKARQDAEINALKNKQAAEIEALENSMAYLEADADQRRKMKRDQVAEFRKMEQEKLAGFKTEAVNIFRVEQLASLASIAMKTSEAMMKAVAVFPASLGEPWVSAIRTLGLIQAGLVLAQKPPSYAQGGDFVTSGPQMIMVGDNPGSRERVQITPLSSPNINGPQGNIVLNISAPLVDETVIDHIIPAIHKAQRMSLA